MSFAIVVTLVKEWVGARSGAVTAATIQLLERVLIEEKFPINPLPVPTGESIRDGVGGVQ